MPVLQVPEHVTTITARLRDAGYQAYVVGGAVRDALLGRAAHDWDVATDALPQVVLDLFPHAVPTGLRFGTVTLPTAPGLVEVTTFRGEGTYSDGRRPDVVTFGSVIDDDLARRDFTVNAIAYEDKTDHIVDPFGGQADLAAKLIRAVGDPRRRFAEDGLRLMRAARLAAQLGFSLERTTLAAATQQRALVCRVAAERVRDELTKLLLAPRPDAGLRLLRHTGLLGEVLPEFQSCVGFQQHCNQHKWDVWEHTVRVVAATPVDLTLRLAALFHDVAKPASFSLGSNGAGHFYGHEKAGAAVTEAALRRLRFDSGTSEAVVRLVRDHMWQAGPHSTAKAMRRLIHRVGPERVPALIALRMADKAGSGTPYNTADVDRLRSALHMAARKHQPLTLQELAVDGHDLIALGVPAGPRIGRLLSELLERVLDNPKLNERETLLALVRQSL